MGGSGANRVVSKRLKKAAVACDTHEIDGQDNCRVKQICPHGTHRSVSRSACGRATRMGHWPPLSYDDPAVPAVVARAPPGSTVTRSAGRLARGIPATSPELSPAVVRPRPPAWGAATGHRPSGLPRCVSPRPPARGAATGHRPSGMHRASATGPGCRDWPPAVRLASRPGHRPGAPRLATGRPAVASCPGHRPGVPRLATGRLACRGV
jgi:hypothetical protein